MANISKHFQGNKSGIAFEHHGIYDEWLLPDAMEFAPLKEIDPEIILWIMDRTTKEQDVRHNFVSERVGNGALAKSNF